MSKLKQAKQESTQNINETNFSQNQENLVVGRSSQASVWNAHNGPRVSLKQFFSAKKGECDEQSLGSVPHDIFNKSRSSQHNV